MELSLRAAASYSSVNLLAARHGGRSLSSMHWLSSFASAVARRRAAPTRKKQSTRSKRAYEATALLRVTRGSYTTFKVCSAWKLVAIIIFVSCESGSWGGHREVRRAPRTSSGSELGRAAVPAGPISPSDALSEPLLKRTHCAWCYHAVYRGARLPSARVLLLLLLLLLVLVVVVVVVGCVCLNSEFVPPPISGILARHFLLALGGFRGVQPVAARGCFPVGRATRCAHRPAIEAALPSFVAAH
eukprot:GHVT01079735.1.p1 GENE.GHVT01079735.1~~GHVT01079735.1.p1  ORF type:complete len:244 (+),score=44.68 GHVT01079735.1:50-781(+)